MLSKDEIKLLIKNPEQVMKNYEIFQEEDWEQIYEYLLTKRIDKELFDSWINSQKNFGKFKYKAIGQLFSRFATLRRGYTTLENCNYVKK